MGSNTSAMAGLSSQIFILVLLLARLSHVLAQLLLSNLHPLLHAHDHELYLVKSGERRASVLFLRLGICAFGGGRSPWAGEGEGGRVVRHIQRFGPVLACELRQLLFEHLLARLVPVDELGYERNVKSIQEGGR